MVSALSANIFSLYVIFVQFCPIDLVHHTPLAAAVDEAVVLSRRHLGHLPGRDGGAVDQVVAVLPYLHIQLTGLHPEGVPLVFVLVLAATASGLDLDAVDGDAVVAKDMLGAAPDLALCVHGSYMRGCEWGLRQLNNK